MQTWWPVIGETSLIAGAAAGLLWAVATTTRRRLAFLKAGARPIAQGRWFVMHFLAMSAYIALVCALGLSSLNGVLPQELFWFMLALSACAFGLALLVPGTAIEPQRSVGAIDLREPPIDPPVPARRSA